MNSFLWIVVIGYYSASLVNAQTFADTTSVIWILDNITQVGGYSTEKLDKFPVVVETSRGKAMQFNGIDEALVVNGNPLGESASFTIEVIIKPDSSLNPINYEQRFLHIQKTGYGDRRILIELRLKKNQQWALDTFIKSENSIGAGTTLLDTAISHPVNEWYHIAFVYENGIAKNFINGKEELSREAVYSPIQNGKISIGARQDPRSWFKGIIRSIRFTPGALQPDEFKLNEFF